MKTLRFGIIGLGHFGKHYVRLLKEIPGVELVLTANNPSESDSVINNKKIDCVVISSPPSTHYDLILRAIDVGKNILVEKPMVLTSREALEIKNKLAGKDLIFMVGFQYLYNDYFRYLKENIAKLGNVRYVMGEHLYGGPIRGDIGSFMDAAVHDCAIVEYLFSPGEVVSVNGVSRSFTDSDRDDFTAATVTFQSGLLVHFLTSWYWPEKVRKVTLVGDRGMAFFNDRDEAKLHWSDAVYPVLDANKSSLFLPDLANRFAAIMDIKASEPLANELEHFIECVNNKVVPLTDIEFGCTITAKMEQIQAGLKKYR